MLDHDLAALYNVEVKSLKRQVRRNVERFPNDFMFQLTKEEYDSLRSQFGTLKRGEHSKYLPYAFTENGVAMLSSVLNSKRAIHVNIQIMRVFTQIREIMIKHQDLQKKIEEMEQKYDKQIMTIFGVLKELLKKPKEIHRKLQIGFKV